MFKNTSKPWAAVNAGTTKVLTHYNSTICVTKRPTYPTSLDQTTESKQSGKKSANVKSYAPTVTPKPHTAEKSIKTLIQKTSNSSRRRACFDRQHRIGIG